MTSLLAVYAYQSISMITSRVIENSFLIYFHATLAIACELRDTTEPFLGVKCVTVATRNAWQTARHQCMSLCMRMENCRYINHNSATGQCELGLGQCESLQPASGVMVNAFGPPRHGCLHWGSRQEPGWVPIVEENGYNYVARTLSVDVLLIATFDTYSYALWGNRGGVAVGPVEETDQDIEFFAKDPACPLPWMPYTAGGPLPVGAVIGGRLADGSPTYVAKVYHDRFLFGYYSPKSAVAYYERRGAQTKTSMDILVLL